MINGFIYEWTDLATGLKYLGKHEGTPNDGYIGSGTIFIKEYNLRPNDFTRKILWSSNKTTATELSSQEEKYLNQISDDDLYYGKNRKYYNQVRNSAGYTLENNPMNNRETVERILNTRTKKGHKNPWQNTVEKYGYDEACRMKQQRMIGNTFGKGNKNKPKTKEHKQKLSENHRGGGIGSSGRKRKMPYDELLKLIAEHGIRGTSELLNEAYEGIRSRYYTAKKKLTDTK